MADSEALRRWLELVKAKRAEPVPASPEVKGMAVHMPDLVPDPAEFVRHLRTYQGRRFLIGLRESGALTCLGCMQGLNDHLAMPVPGAGLN
jgi:hypothetical protein